MKDAELRRDFRRLCQKQRLNLWTDINGVFVATIGGEDAFKIFKLGVEYGRYEMSAATPETEESLFNRMVAASETEDMT